MKKNCVICDAEFEAKHFNTKICYSKECRKEQQARRMAYKRKWRESKEPPIQQRECRNCDTLFPPAKRDERRCYCSSDCSKEYHRNQRITTTKEAQAKIPLRECKACKEMFKPSKDDPRNQLCGYECNITWSKMKSKKRTKERQKNITARVCLTCNEEFIPNRYDIESKQMQKYCEDNCLHNHPQRKLQNNIAHGVRRSLRSIKQRKTNKTFTLLGYTKNELTIHLESHFTEENGYTWDNMGEWHIDHIRPVSSFDFDSTDHPDFKKCWALDNLQPLWASDNCSKGAKWDGVVA